MAPVFSAHLSLSTVPRLWPLPSSGLTMFNLPMPGTRAAQALLLALDKQVFVGILWEILETTRIGMPRSGIVASFFVLAADGTATERNLAARSHCGLLEVLRGGRTGCRNMLLVLLVQKSNIPAQSCFFPTVYFYVSLEKK